MTASGADGVEVQERSRCGKTSNVKHDDSEMIIGVSGPHDDFVAERGRR